MKKNSTAKKTSSTAGTQGGKTPTARQFVYQRLVQKIVSGEIPSGQPLFEVPISKELGVSRTPVREAIGQLVSEGVLHEIAGRGTIIIEPTRQDIEEIYQLREALETFAVAMAAERGLATQDLASIEKLVEGIPVIQADLEKSGKPALSGESLLRFLASDLRFHMHLLQAAGNRRIVRVIGNTRLLMRIFTFRREQHTAPLLKQVYAYHRQILDAVINKNPEEAARCMRDHIRLSLRERLAEYQQNWESGGRATGLDEMCFS